jgi:hypothetical protein
VPDGCVDCQATGNANHYIQGLVLNLQVRAGRAEHVRHRQVRQKANCGELVLGKAAWGYCCSAQLLRKPGARGYFGSIPEDRSRLEAKFHEHVSAWLRSERPETAEEYQH